MIEVSEELQIYSFAKGIKLIKPNSINSNSRLTLKNVLQLPFAVYLENIDHITIKNNRTAVNEFGFASSDDAIGKPWFANFKSNTVIESLTNDKKVTSSNSFLIAEEKAMRNDGNTVNKLSVKMPWYNYENRIIGLFGCSIILGKNSLAESLTHIAELGLFNPNQLQESNEVFNSKIPHAFKLDDNSIPYLFHKENSKPILLAPQQMRCLKLLVNGFTDKEIATQLNLSYRTVNHYLDRLRKILGCRSSKEMIAFYKSQIV